MKISLTRLDGRVIIATAGLQGPAGPAGADGSTHVHSAAFAHDDSAVLIGSVSAGNAILRAFIEIVTPFDGAVALTVGKDGATACLMTIAQNTPAAIGVYATTPLWVVDVPTDFYLYLTGSPTVGAGTALITLG